MFTTRAVVKTGLTMLMLVLLATTGCQEEASGPSTDEFEAARAAQAERAAAKKIEVSKPSPKIAVAPAPESTDGGFGAVEVGFSYDPTDKRDPFRNFKWERPDRVTDRAGMTPLERYDLSQLSLVAVVWKTGNARALVQDPSGESYIIAEGASIGKNSGTVLDIEDNLVRVRETYVDFLGRETTKAIELRMPGNEGG